MPQRACGDNAVEELLTRLWVVAMTDECQEIRCSIDDTCLGMRYLFDRGIFDFISLYFYNPNRVFIS